MQTIDDSGFIEYFQIEDGSYKNLKIVKYIPDKTIINLVSMVTIFLLIIMSNLIIYNYSILFLELKNNNTYYRLKKYYYGEYFIDSRIIKKVFLKIIVFCVLMYSILFYFQKNYIANIEYKIIVYVLGLISLGLMVSLQYLFYADII